MSSEKWLVESDDGDREVLVQRMEDDGNFVARRADGFGHNAVVSCADGMRLAVTRLASRHGWGVKRILSPAERAGGGGS